MRRTLLEWEPEGAATRGALELLQAIEAQMIQTRRAPPRFAAHAAALRATLDALDMRAALSADVVGAQVLELLDVLEAELAPARGRATLVEFRAVLAAHFEEAAFVDAQFD